MSHYTWYPNGFQKNHDQQQNGLMLPKPPKLKRKFYRQPWFICFITAIITASLCLGGFCIILAAKGGISSEDHAVGKDKTAVDTAEDITQSRNFFNQLKDRDSKTELNGPAIYEKVHSSIVSIETKGSSGGFLNRTITLGSGSGIILSTDGYIVTNNHVIQNATAVTVTLSTGKIYDATLVAKDTQTDLAVIKIKESNLPAADLGDSDKILVGDKAYAIGNPLGKNLYSSFTGGYISGLNRSLDTDNGENGKFIQTDTAINPGNSGGALVNAYGQVIGINTSKYSGSDVEGIGFAIPINEAKKVVDELISKGYVSGRPLMGLVNPQSISDAEKEYYDLADSGVYITGLTKFGAAEKAGIKVGDIITKLDGKRVKTVEELNQIKDQHKAGDTVTVTINRGGKEMEKTLKMAEEKPELTQVPKANDNTNQ